MRLSEIGYKLIWKPALIAFALTLFALPAFAYTRTPSGNSIYNPVSFDISLNNLNYFSGNWGTTFFSAVLHFTGSGDINDLKAVSVCYSYANNPTGFTDLENNLPLGDYYQVRVKEYTNTTCNSQSSNDSALEGTQQNVLFTIITPPTPPAPAVAFITPTSTAGNLLAAVGDQLGDEGFLTFAILSAGLLLGFYLMEKIISLTPK